MATPCDLQIPVCSLNQGACNGANPACRCEGSTANGPYVCDGATGFGVCKVGEGRNAGAAVLNGCFGTRRQQLVVSCAHGKSRNDLLSVYMAPPAHPADSTLRPE